MPYRKDISLMWETLYAVILQSMYSCSMHKVSKWEYLENAFLFYFFYFIFFSQEPKWKTLDTWKLQEHDLNAIRGCSFTFCITGLKCVTWEQHLCYVCFRKLHIDPSGTVFAGNPMRGRSSGGKSEAKALTDRASPEEFFHLIGVSDEKGNLLLASKPKSDCSVVFRLFG